MFHGSIILLLSLLRYYFRIPSMVSHIRLYNCSRLVEVCAVVSEFTARVSSIIPSPQFSQILSSPSNARVRGLVQNLHLLPCPGGNPTSTCSYVRKEPAHPRRRYFGHYFRREARGPNTTGSGQRPSRMFLNRYRRTRRRRRDTRRGYSTRNRYVQKILERPRSTLAKELFLCKNQIKRRWRLHITKTVSAIWCKIREENYEL